MRKVKCVAIAALFGLATNCWAQQSTVKSTVCNPDGTVTFNYQNDSAKSVLVDVQFAGRKEMTRNADGVWTVTLGPAAPDM